MENFLLKLAHPDNILWIWFETITQGYWTTGNKCYVVQSVGNWKINFISILSIQGSCLETGGVSETPFRLNNWAT